ncbi:MAG: histidine--tRNA ligase [Thermoproteales archaeon]|nr:histidine--tRNA ligase [Thermoproteales archaeon]RLE65209.1 MAG: histidine--tRNA ligase [Thermoprotei archaeon]
MRFSRPRGTRDYIPPETFVRKTVIEKARQVFERYGYSEIVTPAFEYLELLEAKAGPEIKEQIYWFKDKGGRLLGLRFDLTTSIARVIANNPGIPKPIRFYYIAPVWRYEEPQKGRLREFWQAGVELIGSPKSEADAEVIALTYRFFEDLGLENGLIIKINSRKIADIIARKAGIDENEKDTFFRAIDKLYKQGVDKVREELGKIGLSEKTINYVIENITIKGDLEEKINKASKILGETGPLMEVNELVYSLIEVYDIPEKCIDLDFSIVRGIGYYTGTVFEFMHEKALDLGALAAGGRYDKLIEILGGVPTPATGMSIGIERVCELYKRLNKKVIENIPPTTAQVIVIPVKNEEHLVKTCTKIAERLRKEGFSTIIDVQGRKIRGNLEYASKLNIPIAIIVGERELTEKRVTVKDLRKYSQESIEMEVLVSKLKEKLL